MRTMRIVGMLGALVALWSANAQAAREVTCTVDEVKEFSNRVHVRCEEDYSLPGSLGHPLRYFAAPKTSPTAGQLAILGENAKNPGPSRLIVTYEPTDLTGSSFGCQTQNCRPVQGLQLKPRGRRVEVTLPDVDGESRTAVIYPTILPNAPAPVLFFFHGNTGSAVDSISKVELHNHWPEATIVYGEGTAVTSNGDPTSNTDDYHGWTLRFPYKFAFGQRKDVQYVLRLLDKLRKNGGESHINAKRVYAAGGSSGGFFTFSLMELMPDIFRGYAVIGSYARYKVQLESMECSGSRPTLNRHARPLPLNSPEDRAFLARPVLYLFGTNDTILNGDPTYRGTGCDENDLDRLNGWTSDFRLPSHASNTLRQLLIRNHARWSLIGNGSPPWWTVQGVTPYKADPLDERGAPVYWNIYNGGHFHPDAGEWMRDFFKALPEN